MNPEFLEPVRLPRGHDFRREAARSGLRSLAAAQQAVQSCRRCPLHAAATQAVFGAGPRRAAVMFVGEQPGDQEDRAGQPFVGPAGRVLAAALGKAGIARRQVYLTNAVKHFKFRPRGKRRLHQRPDAGEIRACRFWLELERLLVRPQLVVALGATAAQSLTGKAVTIGPLRGQDLQLEDGTALVVTIHPSYLLRIRDRSARAAEARRFEAELAAIARRLEALAGTGRSPPAG